MYRIVHYYDDEDRLAELSLFSLEATRTILQGMDFVFPEGFYSEEFEEFYELVFSTDFFKGIGKYIGAENDEVAGREIVYRKLGRMKDKLLDINEWYTFDLMEEYILAALSSYSKQLYPDEEMGRDVPGLKNALINYFYLDELDFDPDIIEDHYLSLTDIREITIREDQDDNLIFWDYDYEYFFENGFIGGLLKARSHMDYGYLHTCKIFSDIGVNYSPLRLTP